MSDFTIKSKGACAVIEIPDKSFEAYTEALSQLRMSLGNRKIWTMQSVEKDGEPFRIFIVFEF